MLLAARRILVARHARFLSLRSRKRRLPRSPSSLPYSHVETTQKPEVRLRTVIATARACAAWSSFRNHELIGAAARLLAYQLVPARPRFCLEAHIARNGACWLMSRRGTRRRLTEVLLSAANCTRASDLLLSVCRRLHLFTHNLSVYCPNVYLYLPPSLLFPLPDLLSIAQTHISSLRLVLNHCNLDIVC